MFFFFRSRPFHAGLCGDPAGPGQQYLPNGPIVAEYRSGEVITVEVAISTHHRGHFELFLCDMDTVSGNEVTAGCLLSHPLQRDPTDTAISPPDNRSAYSHRYYIEPRCATATTDAAYSTPLNSSSLCTLRFLSATPLLSRPPVTFH